jgi:hypothetical protein
MPEAIGGVRSGIPGAILDGERTVAGEEGESALVEGLDACGKGADLAQFSLGRLGIKMGEGGEIERNLFEQGPGGGEGKLAGGMEEELAEARQGGIQTSWEGVGIGAFAHQANPP